jgi:methyltransferase (TIGR00027 family)
VDNDLAATARVTAGWRAIETEREDALFRDPWARALAGADLVAEFASQPPELRQRGASVTIIRTRVFDDWLASRHCPQVVLLGAGLDTRAFRLSWPEGTRLWELDQPQILDAKDAVMSGVPPRCTRHALPANLTGVLWPELLVAVTFNPRLPTAWLVEGVLPYLEPEDAERLLGTVATLSAPGSVFLADFVSQPFMAARNSYLASVAPKGSALFHFGVDDPAALLADHGWQVDAVKRPGDPDAHFGRWALPPGAAGFCFVNASRPA